MPAIGAKELKGINNVVEEEQKAIPKLVNIVQEIENILHEQNDQSFVEKTSMLKDSINTMGDYLKYYFQSNLRSRSYAIDFVD